MIIQRIAEIAVPLKCLGNFLINLEIPLINSETKFVLNWSVNFTITNSAVAETWAITDTKLFIPVVTLSTQDNSKLLQQLKSGFKHTINWNKYQSKVSVQA